MKNVFTIASAGGALVIGLSLSGAAAESPACAETTAAAKPTKQVIGDWVVSCALTANGTPLASCRIFEAGTELQLVCEHRGARAVGHMQFLQHGRHVPFHSVQGAGKIFGDFQVAFARRNEQQNFPLPGA